MWFGRTRPCFVFGFGFVPSDVGGVGFRQLFEVGFYCSRSCVIYWRLCVEIKGIGGC